MTGEEQSLERLETEAVHPDSLRLDDLTPLELVELMNREDARIAPAVADQLLVIAQAVELIAERLAHGGRLLYLGAGTSGRLGVLDAAECPPTFNTPPEMVIGLIAGGDAALRRAVEGAEDRADLARADLHRVGVTSQDVVVGIASSGRTPYVLAGLDLARQLGAATIGIVCTPDARLAACSDLLITLRVGPEVLAGSTRLKAGTATKMVLNMLSTGAMVRLGKTFGNLMVDLKATNTKLRARAVRIVRRLTGLDAGQAQALLDACDGEVKTAVVAHLGRMPPAEARQRLQASRGHVRRALDNTAQHWQPWLDFLGSQVCLGIDGGGSKTKAFLAVPTDVWQKSGLAAPGTDRVAQIGGEQWTILGQGQAGPSNPLDVGFERALRHVDAAVQHAFHDAGLPRAPVRSACLGIAGAARKEVHEQILGWARRSHLAHRVNVVPDVDLVFAAGGRDVAVAVIAGTGAIVVGQKGNDRVRVGGWGSFLSDDGSAYDLARQALRAVMHAHDGLQESTSLTASLLQATGVSSPREWVLRFAGSEPTHRSAIAALAPLVIEESCRGDAVARQIVVRGTRQLARAVAAVAQKLQLSPTSCTILLAGGLLTHSDHYRALLFAALAELGLTDCSAVTIEFPALGALHLAWRTCGKSA